MIGEQIKTWRSLGVLDEEETLIERCINGRPAEVGVGLSVSKMTDEFHEEIKRMLLENYLMRFCSGKKRGDAGDLQGFKTFLREQMQLTFFQSNVWRMLDTEAKLQDEEDE